MGNTNEIQNQYWEDTERFADLLNVLLFEGAQIVRGSDLCEAFDFIRHSLNGETLTGFLKTERERFQNLPEDTYDFIASVTNASELQKLKHELKSEGRYDMCRGIDEMMAKSEERGRKIGESVGEERGRKIGESVGEERGRKAGEQRSAALAKALLDSNRMEDLKRMLTDTVYRGKLMMEMEIK